MHVPDPAVPYEDTVGAFADLQREGKVRHIGVSNVNSDQLVSPSRSAKWPRWKTATTSGTGPPKRWWHVCEQQDIVFFPWQPVAPADPGVNRTLALVAQAHGVSVQQVALAWLLGHSPIVVPIPGTTNIDHLDDNIDAAWLFLTDADIASLDAADVAS